MKITLKPDAKPMKQRPYHLNPKYKERVYLGIIELVEESNWVSPMVVQEKKQKDEIRICIDLKKLNDACVNDPFPTLFTNEVLDNVGGQEANSFTDGFSGYHQIKIASEDKSKTTFMIEFGCFQYTIMPFGMKNAPTIFSCVVIAMFKEFIHKFLEIYFDDWTMFGLPVKDCTGVTVAKFLFEYVLTKYGCPKVLMSDHSTHFLNETISGLTEEFQVYHQKSMPYHPRDNGMVEAFNKILESAITKVCNAQMHDWDVHVPAALWAYITNCKKLTGQTPFKFVYGIEVVMLME
eukprot:PITA_18710